MSNTVPDTMAEAFCEEHLISWTEHGQDFTGWLHRDIFTRCEPDEPGRRHQPVPSTGL